MLGMMLNPFLLKTGFTASDIATVSKFFGIIMVIIGGIISGPLITRWGMRTSLIRFGVIHMLGHGLFILFFFLGKNIGFLYFITAYEALTGGMLMTAYIAFMASLCHGRYVATQYALMSSGMGLSRVLLPAISGLVVDVCGWLSFFWIVSALSLLCVIFVWVMPKGLYDVRAAR
jgi:PAT family beta-lactamase induction signal transducer AmpG